MFAPDGRLGERVKARREGELKWTLDDLAEAAKLTKGYLSKVERGKAGTRGVTRGLQRMADALNRRWAWLESGQGPMEPEAEAGAEARAGLDARTEKELDSLSPEDRKLVQSMIRQLRQRQDRPDRPGPR